jgi:hypothetical protein
MKVEQTGCSETSAHKIQTSGNYPKEIIQHSKHSETLKSRCELQGDQKFYVHLMITIQKVTSNVQSVPRQSPDIY